MKNSKPIFLLRENVAKVPCTSDDWSVRWSWWASHKLFEVKIKDFDSKCNPSMWWLRCNWSASWRTASPAFKWFRLKWFCCNADVLLFNYLSLDLALLLNSSLRFQANLYRKKINENWLKLTKAICYFAVYCQKLCGSTFGLSSDSNSKFSYPIFGSQKFIICLFAYWFLFFSR